MAHSAKRENHARRMGCTVGVRHRPARSAHAYIPLLRVLGPIRLLVAGTKSTLFQLRHSPDGISIVTCLTPALRGRSGTYTASSLPGWDSQKWHASRPHESRRRKGSTVGVRHRPFRVQCRRERNHPPHDHFDSSRLHFPRRPLRGQLIPPTAACRRRTSVDDLREWPQAARCTKHRLFCWF